MPCFVKLFSDACAGRPTINHGSWMKSGICYNISTCDEGYTKKGALYSECNGSSWVPPAVMCPRKCNLQVDKSHSFVINDNILRLLMRHKKLMNFFICCFIYLHPLPITSDLTWSAEYHSETRVWCEYETRRLIMVAL